MKTLLGKLKTILGLVLFIVGICSPDSPGLKGPLLAFGIAVIGFYLLSDEFLSEEENRRK